MITIIVFNFIILLLLLIVIINGRTAIAGAIIGLLFVFLRLEEEYWFSLCLFSRE